MLKWTAFPHWILTVECWKWALKLTRILTISINWYMYTSVNMFCCFNQYQNGFIHFYSDVLHLNQMFDFPVDVEIGIAFISVLMQANSPKTEVIAIQTMFTIHHCQLPGIWRRYNVQKTKWTRVAVAAKSRHWKQSNKFITILAYPPWTEEAVY